MQYDSNNIFAKIIRGDIPCAQVYRDENVLAFRDMHPAAPVHVLVVPCGEYTSFDDFTAKASGEVISNFFKKVREIAHDLGVAESGYRLITNHGKNASQSVPHFHVHILGGRPLGGLLRDDDLDR
jgi:histidine triad (HIT) family protein